MAGRAGVEQIVGVMRAALGAEPAVVGRVARPAGAGRRADLAPSAGAAAHELGRGGELVELLGPTGGAPGRGTDAQGVTSRALTPAT